MKLKDIFRDHVSSGSFKKIDGEIRLVGKFGQVSLIDDVFDIWIIMPNFTPLSTAILNNLVKKMPQELEFTRLNGEAYTNTRDKSLVLKTFFPLGIKAKRKLSQQASLQLIDRLRGEE